MRAVSIMCYAKDCLHYSHDAKTCGVSYPSFIDISRDGKCIDYSPLTDVEYKICTGRRRE